MPKNMPKTKTTFYEKHGVDEALFLLGVAAIEIGSPYPSEYGKGISYYARAIYGGYELYDESGNRFEYVRDNTGNAARIEAAIYDGIDDDVDNEEEE